MSRKWNVYSELKKIERRVDTLIKIYPYAQADRVYDLILCGYAQDIYEGFFMDEMLFHFDMIDLFMDWL